MIRRHLIAGAAALGLLALGSGAVAQRGGRLAAKDSFRIGSDGVQCTAQIRPMNPDAPGMFDRAYAIVCRDAAGQVGQLYALRTSGADAAGQLMSRRATSLDCGAPVTGAVGELSGVAVADCKRRDDGLPYRLYTVARGNTLYVAEGLRGYDSAVSLGLRTLVANRPVEGTVEVAVTEAGDPAAFARTQAGTLDAQGAMTEGYARNNAGNFAEAAAFFSSLVDGVNARANDGSTAEYYLNNGLQQSNLGNAPAAELSFRQAQEHGAAGDAVLGRLLRNYRTMAALNRRDTAGALAVLDAPVAPLNQAADEALARGTITSAMADRINRANGGSRRLGAMDERLRPYERAQLLDAQAALLRGTALRLRGNPGKALAAFDRATTMLTGVRGGRVATAGFLQAEILAESALVREQQRDYAAADRDLAQALQLIELNYPRSASGLTAKARLAAYRARRGDSEGALKLYGEVVADSPEVPGGAAPLRDLLRPYFSLLAKRGNDQGSAAAMFAASQVLVRPGLAQTQAVLARELSAGDDEAARLFREAVNRSREVARASGEVAALAQGDPANGTAEAAALDAARARLEALQKEQVGLQAKLADYPRYRVLDPQGLALGDLQKALKPGEAYYELRVLGPDAYAMLVTPDRARAFKVAASGSQLADDVAALRASIVQVEGGKSLTQPFDLALARKLYVALFGPVADAMPGVNHLIYEADGPLLQLPPNLLVADQASVDAYRARTARANADLFDYRGVQWLGRGRDVTTAVSPRAFLDVRAAPPSKAKQTYLGMGQNAQPSLMASFLSAQPDPSAFDRCAWPADAWRNPISAKELYAARDFLGAQRSEVETGTAFSDSAIQSKNDLGDFRIVHFATHGVVTAPRPECPARPALMTSFGAQNSDGLLSFREIYDLRMDADLVILSACDTAGMATIEATREAGVTTGGNFALDGLVRAFVGAGARTVVASHWPVPDDYDATKRLILGMVGAAPGVPVATALRNAETRLMDDPATSHPFYWAAFAVVGDGSRPLTSGR